MDLPDCPPGAEGYQDTVTEVPKKLEDNTNTKAEQEFQKHISSLKIRAEDGSNRSMVERRGRDASGKWIYLCLPCAAMCCGEAIMQTHISGKKHKNKLASKTIWPMSTFQPHKQANQNAQKKMEGDEEVAMSPLEVKLNNAKKGRCHIEDIFDTVKAPLIGVEYLVEHPPLEAHYEPSYICTLCNKQGHPRTIVNHMTCFWHRHNYLQRHYPKACELLKPYRSQTQYRDGVMFIMSRIAQRIVEKYGRMNPINIDKEDYDKDKEFIHQWIYKGKHFCETEDCTFEEVVDNDLIATLHKSNEKPIQKDPSPPIVAVPKPAMNRSSRRKPSVESLSDLSDELERISDTINDRASKAPSAANQKQRFEPYNNMKGRDFGNAGNARSKYTQKSASNKGDAKGTRPANYEYKVKLGEEKRQALEDAAKKTLAYHEKNPEKHPLYPEEWKKFWNRRYKEIQAEGKDPSKHDFKPEWIVFWTARMRELHREELRVQVVELYRKLCLTPPPAAHQDAPPADKPRKRPSPDHEVKHKDRRRSPEPRRRPSFETRRHSPDHRRPGPDLRRRSPDPRRRSPDMRDMRRRSPDLRRRSPDPRRRSPQHFRRNIRSPLPHHHDRRRSPLRRHSPPKISGRSRSPIHSMRSPGRTNIMLESRGSRSPLSRRDTALRNRSPGPRHSPHRNPEPGYTRNRSPLPPPSASLQTVLISDDELKPDDGLSPWNSDNDLDSLGSLPSARSTAVYSRTGSVARSLRHDGKPDLRDSEPENIVATLRLLVALEDYLGSLGPKVIDLLAEAIRMEKEKANSSEELLERDGAVVLLETAKEKLKGAAQAGLVGAGAAAAVRAAVVRTAATLHEADKRMRAKKAAAGASGGGAVVGVAGVGAVQREQIAAQMAAALVAQGKTDVSAEELAQLVDAVVGMAEAKKREADEKKQTSGKPAAAPAPAPALSGTASALQMLQSAYDDKKVEKEDAPDAMDGLSDSDLETLLKNFNELSAEEQHSLIAYLKKLEAREPQRVERLRQYVSAAARNAPVTPHANANPEAPAPAPAPGAPPALDPAPAIQQDLLPVTIESDDDDYTVEEVFKSATQKVKENQIRQEMEIVKKSLEESKVPAAQTVTPAAPALSLAGNTNVLKNMTSAADLFALVQASLQSANVQVPAQIPKTAEVVTSNTHPRSFGDLPEAPNPMMSQNFLPQNFTQSSDNQQSSPFGTLMPPQNLTNFGGNNPVMQGDLQPFKPVWEHRSLADIQQTPGSISTDQGYRQDNYNQDNSYNQNRGPQDIYYNQGGRGPQDNTNTQNDSFNLMGRAPHDNSYIQMGRTPMNNSNNQFGMGQQDDYNQMGRGQQEDFNQGRRPQNNFFNQGGSQDSAFNQGGMASQNMFNQRTQGGNYSGMNNNRMQDNSYDGRLQNVNKNNQNNRRGRGRGHAGNRGRGRGRGGFN